MKWVFLSVNHFFVLSKCNIDCKWNEQETAIMVNINEVLGACLSQNVGCLFYYLLYTDWVRNAEDTNSNKQKYCVTRHKVPTAI